MNCHVAWLTLMVVISISGCRDGGIGPDVKAGADVKNAYLYLFSEIRDHRETADIRTLMKGASVELNAHLAVQRCSDGNEYLFCQGNRRVIHINTNVPFWIDDRSAANKIAVFVLTEDLVGMCGVDFSGNFQVDNGSKLVLDRANAYWPPIGVEPVLRLSNK